MQPEKLAPVSYGALPEELILRNFAAAIGRRRYEHWFHQKTRFRVEGDEVVISVSNPFLVTWLPQNFRTPLITAAQPVLGPSATIRFEVSCTSEDHPVTAPGATDLKSVLSQSPVLSVERTPGGRTGRAQPAAEPVRESRSAQTRSSSVSAATAASMATAATAAIATVAAAPAARASRAESVPVASRPAEPRRSSKTRSSASSQPDSPVTRQTAPVQETPPPEPAVPAVRRYKRDGASSSGLGPLPGESSSHTRRYADLLEFVEGTSNEFAMAAARQVTESPGAQFTTLFIHGPVGVGKSHLLEGICKELKHRLHGKQVVYLTAEAFANYFTQALREHKLPSFRQKFRSVEALIVDDIDFLVGKPGIQEEFLFTLQHLESHGRQVVVAAHGHPRLLTKLSDELKTRFLSGMVCRIDAPDAALRRRFVQARAIRQRIDLSPEIVQFIADRFRNNIRELEGAFNTLCAYQKMQGKRLSVTAARQVLADLERDCIRVVRLADVEHAVCSLFGVTTEDLKSSKRQKSLSQPRMLAMYLARKHTRSAYAEIGNFFGGRNHSTVMAAEKKIAASLKGSESIKIHSQMWQIGDLIETLEQQLQAG